MTRAELFRVGHGADAYVKHTLASGRGPRCTWMAGERRRYRHIDEVVGGRIVSTSNDGRGDVHSLVMRCPLRNPLYIYFFA